MDSDPLEEPLALFVAGPVDVYESVAVVVVVDDTVDEPVTVGERVPGIVFDVVAETVDVFDITLDFVGLIEMKGVKDIFELDDALTDTVDDFDTDAERVPELVVVDDFDGGAEAEFVAVGFNVGLGIAVLLVVGVPVFDVLCVIVLVEETVAVRIEEAVGL